MRSTTAPKSRRWIPALSFAAALVGSKAAHAVPRVALRDVRSSHQARYYVDVGDFTSGADVTDPSLCAVARRALVSSLARDRSVTVGDPFDALTGRGLAAMLRGHHLRGYVIDGRVRVVHIATASRIEVSLVVQTNPGREYRFESAVTITLSGGDARQRAAGLADATRRAVQSAAAQTIGQLAAG